MSAAHAAAAAWVFWASTLHPRARVPHCGGDSASASAAGQPASAPFTLCARLCLTRRGRHASTISCSGCTPSRQTATGPITPALHPSVANCCRPPSLLTLLLLPATARHVLSRRPLSSRMAGTGMSKLIHAYAPVTCDV